MSHSSPRGQNLLVLTKITAILDAFTLAHPELTLADIRDRTGLPTSTVQRLVANLVEQGFLDRSLAGYRIGLRMAHWAGPSTAGMDVLDVLRPLLEGLRDETTETAALYRYSRGYRVCVALAETRHAIRRAMRVGQIMPLHAGSAGRIILAYGRGVEPAGELEPLTEDTITDRGVLREAVAEARRLGYAITVGERQSDSGGVSAPVFDASADLVGALTVMGPTVRLDRSRIEEIASLVVARADEMTRILGGRRPGDD